MSGLTVEFVSWGNAVRTVTLEEGHPLVIGRSPDADVLFDDIVVLSRRHCRVWSEGGRAWVEPLNCRGSIYVNGSAIQGTHEVTEGNEVLLAGYYPGFRLRPGVEPTLRTASPQDL